MSWREHLGAINYITNFRTFSFRLPRASGKTYLIQHIAGLVDNPLIITQNINDYPKHLQCYCTTSTQFHRGKQINALLIDQVIIDEYPAAWNLNKDFFYLRVYT